MISPTGESVARDARRTLSASSTSRGTVPSLGQFAAVFFFLFTILGNLWSLLAVILLSRQSFYLAAVLVLYICFINSYGFKAASSMGKKPAFKGWKLWEAMRGYFTGSKLHKTVDLPPSGRYLFVVVPHGILSVSSWLTFCTDALGFSDLFPGLDVRPVTLDINFSLPFIREYCLASGLRSASRQSIKSILNSGPGAAVALVPGGASEALLADPGAAMTDVLTARRKGFVRMTLATGASIVPVVAIGEADLWQTIRPAPDSHLTHCLALFKRMFGFSTPLATHFFPKPTPLDIFVGSPIHIPEPVHQEGGSSAQVDELHGKFLVELQSLWEKGQVVVKDRHGKDPTQLRFV